MTCNYLGIIRLRVKQLETGVGKCLYRLEENKTLLHILFYIQYFFLISTSYKVYAGNNGIY